MSSPVEQFYDTFSDRLVRDYIFGNRRVLRQLGFFSRAIPSTSRRVLVVGCGTGEAAQLVAKRIAPRSQVLGIDISSANIRFARELHPHSRVRYQHADILTGEIEGTFDVALLPDVYEHISQVDRPRLHSILDRLLSANGRILLTVPSPATQICLARTGGLQYIDEIVRAEDIFCLARDTNCQLAYLNTIAVWQTNDYVHAMICRNAGHLYPLDDWTRVRIQGSAQSAIGELVERRRLDRVERLFRAAFRYWRVRRVRTAVMRERRP